MYQHMPAVNLPKGFRMDRKVIFEAVDLKINAIADNGTDIPIVKGINFKVREGEVVALIGESGSGKTTIALSSLGYFKPGLQCVEGEARLLGQDLTKMSNEDLRKIRGERVAYLAQSAAATFNPSLRINEQVTESAVIHGSKTKEEALSYAKTLYKRLDLPNPENIGERYPHQVSGGQLQRLMAAMALVSDPTLLVLDEPTTALDVTTQIEVLKAFKKVIREQKAAAIYVTHDLAVVAQIADRIIVLYNGSIQEKGPANSIIETPKHPYTDRLMKAVRPLPKDTAELREDTKNKKLKNSLSVKDVLAGYGGITNGVPKITVLENINIEIGKGEVVGVIGESGSGKSTLARVISGLLPAAEGSVSLFDSTLPSDLRKRSRDQLRRIQFVYQMADTALNPRHTIERIVGRPLEFYHGMKGEKRKKRLIELLEMVELPKEFLSRYPEELSGGQKQRISLARALAAEPEIILCDEVTSALDSIVGSNVIELLRKLQKNLDVSYVFISHDLSTIASFADRIVVMYNGIIVEQGPVHEVLSPPSHPYTELLISSIPELRVGWLEEADKKIGSIGVYE